MSKHRKLGVLMMAGVLTVAGTATAFAASKSNTQTASELFVNESGDCLDSNDNYISSGDMRVVVKARSVETIDGLRWELKDKTRVIAKGDLDVTGAITITNCSSTYVVAVLDWHDEAAVDVDDSYADGDYIDGFTGDDLDVLNDAGNLQSAFAGSVTLRVSFPDGRNFSSDSFRLP